MGWTCIAKNGTNFNGRSHHSVTCKLNVESLLKIRESSSLDMTFSTNFSLLITQTYQSVLPTEHSLRRSKNCFARKRHISVKFRPPPPPKKPQTFLEDKKIFDGTGNCKSGNLEQSRTDTLFFSYYPSSVYISL